MTLNNANSFMNYYGQVVLSRWCCVYDVLWGSFSLCWLRKQAQPQVLGTAKTPDSLTRGCFRVPKFQFSMGYQKSKLLVHTFVKRMAQQLLSIITLLCWHAKQLFETTTLKLKHCHRKNVVSARWRHWTFSEKLYEHWHVVKGMLPIIMYN